MFTRFSLSWLRLLNAKKERCRFFRRRSQVICHSFRETSPANPHKYRVFSCSLVQSRVISVLSYTLHSHIHLIEPPVLYVLSIPHYYPIDYSEFVSICDFTKWLRPASTGLSASSHQNTLFHYNRLSTPLPFFFLKYLFVNLFFLCLP